MRSRYRFHSLYYDPSFFLSLPELPANIRLFEINSVELAKISTLQTPQGILALVYLPEEQEPDTKTLKGHFSLLLDSVQDPGNLGTIIRTADWFGIEHVICSPETVDVYNPKTVQSTMGSLARVSVGYTPLLPLIEAAAMPVFGALLQGQSIYATNWGQEGFILLGNEGHGIEQDLQKKISVPVTIPRIGQAESLNVAISAAIFCSELRRAELNGAC